MITKSRVRRSLGRIAPSHLLEELESRTMLSGNIVATVTSGELYLKGNNLNNSIIVDQLSLATGQFRITSGDGTTTINGQSTAQVFSGVTGIAVTIGSGNDTVVIQNATIANSVQVTGACGNQVITLNNVMIGGNFALSNSGGQNSTTVENSSITGSISVSAGVGYSSQCGGFWGCTIFSDANELFTLSASSIGSNVTVSNVSGETTTDIEYSTIGNNLSVTNGANTYGNCGFHCSSSTPAGDLLTLNGSSVGNNVSISNDSDGNTTNIVNSSITGTLAVNNLVGTNSQSCFNSCFSGNLASASDAFTLSGSSVGSNVALANISDGATANIANSSIIGNLTVNNGVGSYGQGFTSCRGQVSSTYGDLLTMSESTVVNSITITNGSTYNSTDIEYSSVGGNVAVSNGLNFSTQSTCNSCGNSCGGSCGNSCCNSCGSSCGGTCGGSNSVYTTDLFTMNGTSIGGNLTVANASGYTNTAINGSVVGNNATFTNANGTAIFEMSNSIIGYNLLYTAGTGSTTVTVTGSIIDNNATITVASNATITISPTEVGGTLKV